MSLLKQLVDLFVQNDHNWIPTETFAAFLNSSGTDRCKNIKPSDFHRLTSISTKLIEGKQCIDKTSALKYIFAHSHSKPACEKLANDITDAIFVKEDTASDWDTSRLDVYRKLLQSPIYEGLTCAILKLTNVESFDGISEDILIYRNIFTENEWQIICLFECNVALCYPEFYCKNPLEQDELRWAFLDLCLSAQQLASGVAVICKNTIKQRQLRKKSAEAVEGIQIECMVTHIPKAIDCDIVTHVEERTGISIEAVCVDHHSSVQNNLIIVFIELKKSLFAYWNTVSHCIDEILIELHNVRNKQVYLDEGILQKYRNDTDVARFSLRDDYMSDIFQSSIVKTRDVLCDESNYMSEIDKCFSCYPSELPKPLSLDNFDIFEEWLLGVPLPVQSFFLVFINKNSLEKAKGDERIFLSKKLKRLYLFFDGLLNTLNRNHMGILQIANTDELLLHYKSVTTVFEITGSAGVTRSFKQAERLLYPNAVDDYVYFNTFIKGTPVTYETDAGLITKPVKLKDSEIVVIIDNLHRLLSRSDPQPGCSQIGQLNTLQITLQAIPQDSISVLNLHTSDCDGDVDCPCKQQSFPGKNAVGQILNCDAQEEQVYQNACQLMRHGNPALWQLLDKNGELGKIIQDLCVHSTEADEDNIQGQVFVPLDMVSGDVEAEYDESSFQLHRILSDSENQCDVSLVLDRDMTDDVDSDGLSDIEPLDNADFMMGFFQGMSCNPSNINLEESFGNMTLDDLQCDDIVETHVLAQQPDSLSNALHEVGVVLNDFEATSSEAVNDSEAVKVSEEFNEVVVNVSECERAKPYLSEYTDSGTTLQTSCSSVPDKSNISQKNILKQQGAEPMNFDIRKFKAPDSIFYKHLTQIGRDDDIEKLKQILRDLQRKLAKEEDESSSERILFGGDHKLANNLLKLMSMQDEFKKFLPMPPVLHLRKSRINTLFSTFEGAGIVQILQVMRNDARKDWTLLAGKDHIDMATQNVRRISLAIQMSFHIMFSLTLSPSERQKFLDLLYSGSTLEIQSQWDSKYQNFLQHCGSRNATFQLHIDMLKYCNIITAIKLAERMGGKDGFLLLLAAIKNSLSWSFLNGATCYAPFCVHLLHAYYSSSHYHQNLVHVMWSTPVKNGSVNHGPDTKRELFHQDATPAIRTSRSEKAVTTRLARLDYFTKVHDLQMTSRKNNTEVDSERGPDRLSWHLTESDVAHVHRGAALIVTRLAKYNICSDASDTPMNIYNKDVPLLLNPTILDSETSPSLGKYMVMKYLAKKKLFGIKEDDLPDQCELDGPPDLIKKVVKCKGDTIKCTSGTKVSQKSSDEVAEEQRQRSINKEVKKLQGLSSKMNTCQALVNQDCSKRTIRKSTGMSAALSKLNSFTSDHSDFNQHILLAQRHLPSDLQRQIVFVAMEFAGVKFKVEAFTGKEFLEKLESCGIAPILSQLTNVSTLVISEEKYSHTPDTMKGPTRQNRQSQSSSIAHLISDNQILSDNSFDKVAIKDTTRGRQLASNYLAGNVESLKICRHITLVIDSDLSTEGCTCGLSECCCSDRYSVPLKCIFSPSGFVSGSKMKMGIKQRKGEGEMAVADWLLWYAEKAHLSKNEAVAAVITSGDIDAVVIMVYMVARCWPRNEGGSFSSDVYVILQKPSRIYDVYCITGIVEEMEKVFQSQQIGMIIAVSLCIGGNDFLTGFRNKSHAKVLMTVLEHEDIWRNLLKLDATRCVKLNYETFILLVKHLYSNKRTNPSTIPYDVLRQTTICAKRAKSMKTFGIMVNNPGTWLPPQSSILRLASLIDWQIQYLETAGMHEANLPCSSLCSCIAMTPSGAVTYDFGPEAHTSDTADFVSSDQPEKQSKRQKRPLSSIATPQKTSRKRVILQSTPKTKH